MIIGRRKILLSVLVVILGAAIFVNWQFGSNAVSTGSDEASKNLGDAQYVNGSNVTDTAEPEVDDVVDYFSKARLERQQVRDAVKENYEKIGADSSLSDSVKKETLDLFSKMMADAKLENDIENLIKAKGVNECIAIINNGFVTIAIECDELNDVVLLQIKEIANKQTDISFENITIIQVK
ncbi:MAG: SpoIIIAH-like family protein [Clostridia bacterium]|nr:SpoIIIAH-like family protein [Clostridia bacterium]